MPIHAVIKGIDLVLETAPELFSPRAIDPGTLALLSCVDIGCGDKVLDLGCGYGAVGIYAAKIIGPENVFMLDRDPKAIELTAINARRNAVEGISLALSDGFRDFQEIGFTKILSNPPYHVDFSVPRHFIEKGFNRLELGGSLWMVTKRDTWYRQKLTSIFGGVRVHRVGAYFVFEAIKKTGNYATHCR